MYPPKPKITKFTNISFLLDFFLKNSYIFLRLNVKMSNRNLVNTDAVLYKRLIKHLLNNWWRSVFFNGIEFPHIPTGHCANRFILNINWIIKCASTIPRPLLCALVAQFSEDCIPRSYLQICLLKTPQRPYKNLWYSDYQPHGIKQ